MTYPITYIVKKGDTLTSIAKAHNINDWNRLRLYHNNNCPLDDQIGDKIYAGEKLLIPEPDKEVDTNDEAYKTAEREEKVLAVREEEKKKTADEEKKKEAEKGPHDGKFFVVNGATCVCDKAEDPTKTAKIKVTSHKQLVINDEDGKFAVTEDDKTMDPPAATYGKCTLKPSSSGNLPCAPSFAPKWEKTYEKNTVKKKTILTEISTLQCTIGGKITIKKHGQKNSVTQQHAENTDPVEQLLINPAVNKPEDKPAYPGVEAISLKTITGRANFIEVSSKEKKTVEKVKVRLNEQCTFIAHLKNGNKDLTSWIIYGTSGEEKDKKLFVREKTGISFKNAFLQLGTYRVEGYGKPKNAEFNNGENDKNYPSCSIDVEVIVNQLEGSKLLADKGGFFTRVDERTQQVKLREGYPATFKPNFIIDPPSEAEIALLKMYALDESGNIVNDGVQTGDVFTFIPVNSPAVYTIVAEYTNPDGTTSKQSFKGATEQIRVMGITHNVEVIRPGTPMSFSVEKTKYAFLVKKDDDLLDQEAKMVKWSLNGTLIGTGRTINIPGNLLTTKQKYIIEAFIKEANAVGKGNKTKDEEDDWRFEVKDNDVASFTYSSEPKVGKKITLTADKFIMPLIGTEQVNWEVEGGSKIRNTLSIMVTTHHVGKQNFTCKINDQQGVKLHIDVKQAVLNDVMFTDSNGIEITKSSWGQTINMWVDQKYLLDEDFDIQVINEKTDKVVYSKAITKFDGSLIPLVLDGSVKAKAADGGTTFLVKINVPYLKATNEEVSFPKTYSLDIANKREIYAAHIGSQDGIEAHTKVDYDTISYFYAKTRGIKKDEKLHLEIREKINLILLPGSTDPVLLEDKNVYVDDSGAINTKITWSEVGKKIGMRKVYAIIKDAMGVELYNTCPLFFGFVMLLKTPTITKMAEYKSAVLVGSAAGASKDNKNGVCENEARVRAFMRVLRVGEGTIGDSGYSKNFGEKDFIKDYKKDYTTHPRVSLPFGDSSSNAAGAYQFLGKVYDDLKKRFPQYNIPDFSPESQDKLCLVLLKHNYVTDERSDKFYSPKTNGVVDTVKQAQRKQFKGLKDDIIQLLIDNKIERAALISSLGWASMPNSPYGQPIKLKTYADVKAKFDEYLKEELEGKSKEIKIKKGFLREFGYSDCIPLNAPDGIVTYRIYQDGIIEKHIPKTIKKGFENKYKYIYHGSKNVQNDICTVDWHETDEKDISKEKLYTKPTHSEVISDNIVADGQTTRRVKYVNGDIAEYGSNEGSSFWRLYKSLNKKIKLIEMPETVSFVKYKFSNTQRRYTGPNEFAGFIGALAKTGFEITTTGSCFKEGSCFPSQYHVNGRSVDTIYLWDKENDQKFIDALKFYHFKELKVGNDKYFKGLKNVTDGGNLHDTHLHCGEFVNSKILIVN